MLHWLFWNLHYGDSQPPPLGNHVRKLLKQTLYWLFLLLVLGVMGREVPEIASLADDASNDGTVALCLEDVVAEVSWRPAMQGELGYTKDKRFSPDKPQSLSSNLLPPFRAGQDLLHLLTLQRK
jgi:hypothetical protein